MAFLTGASPPIATVLQFLKPGMSSSKAFSLLVLPHTFYSNNFQNRKVEVRKTTVSERIHSLLLGHESPLIAC